MHLIALVCDDPHTGELLRAASQRGFHLHPVPEQAAVPTVLAALEPLGFAGALLLGEAQASGYRTVARASLDARSAERVDSVTATAAGLFGDYAVGRALGYAFAAEGWDLRGARCAVLGTGPEAAVLARELVSQGVAHLSVLASDRPAAEHTLRAAAPVIEASARALKEPQAVTLLESVDLVVRVDPTLDLDHRLLGPHLALVDLTEAPLSQLRRAALQLGARTLGQRDVQAYGIALSLGHILGQAVEPTPFLELFHRAEV